MNATTESGSPEDRNTLLLSYILHGLGALSSGLFAVAGVIVSHIKTGETSNDFIRSHHSWLTRTFWWALLWFVIGWATTVIGLGFVILGITTIWYIYRVIRGAINFAENRPMPD